MGPSVSFFDAVIVLDLWNHGRMGALMLCSTTFGGDGMVEVLVGGRPVHAIVSDYDINSKIQARQT